jgi:hypothetical protein
MPAKARLDVVENEGSIADASFDKDKFVAELDGPSKYEISARILALLTAAQADARSAKNAAWVAAIFAAIAALVGVIALLG